MTDDCLHEVVATPFLAVGHLVIITGNAEVFGGR